VVPVVVHPRHRDHGREEQRQRDDAELGDMAAPVERHDLAGQVPGQEAETRERPCEQARNEVRYFDWETGTEKKTRIAPVTVKC
jgi:hypothetical protein